MTAERPNKVSLWVKGVPFATPVAAVIVAAEVLGPLALIIGLWPRWTAVVLIGFTAVTLWLKHRHAGVGVVFRPRQSGEILESLAVIGGLLPHASNARTPAAA